jgi:3-oxoacyl-[acyl-carrier-protein] synthase-3
LIVATVSPDHMSPSCACFVQRNLGLGVAPAFDVTASCAGFVFALDVAVRAALTGDRYVLAVAAEIRSRFLDITDRATCALFGDGAAAAVIEATEGDFRNGGVAEILGVGTLADGRGVHSVFVPAGGSRRPATAETVAERAHTIRMDYGPEVYLTAIEGMAEVATGLTASLGVAMSDLALVVPHQPNRRILDRLPRVMGISPSRLFVSVEDVGNMSAASCAYALALALERGNLKAGDLVLLVTGGAGYTAGGALLRVGSNT